MLGGWYKKGLMCKKDFWVEKSVSEKSSKIRKMVRIKKLSVVKK